MTKPRIVRSTGTTPSERYLSRLGERSFLRLWSYPNVFIDRFGDASKKQGKELCDLLVVCGDHVLVFSDKSIGWQDDKPVEVAWPRWHRRAIEKSAAQVSGARRWLTKFPDRVFLDAACTQPFPIPIPPPERMKFHGIVVALGAAAACRRFFGEGSGSLIVSSAPMLSPGNLSPPPPFTVVASDDPNALVHVFDDVSLDVALRELDTITDLTQYLAKKEAFILNGNFGFAHGEEELISAYLREVNSKGEHDFVAKSHHDLKPGQIISFDGGGYVAMRNHELYRRKKQADRVSYGWDRLIEKFSKHIMEGSSVVVEGFEQFVSTDKNFELGIRHLALVPRLERRSHSQAILGAFDEIERRDRDRFFRAMLPGPTEPDQTTGFFILLVKRMSALLADKTYDEYRKFRSHMLYAYALNLLRFNPNLDRVVGIAIEGEKKGHWGSSEDLIYFEQPEWTDELTSEAEELRDGFSIFQDRSMTPTSVQPLEYPETDEGLQGPIENIPYGYVEPARVQPGPKLNRHERRARAAKMRRSR